MMKEAADTRTTNQMGGSSVIMKNMDIP
jgi:hypothetical protein